MSSARRKGASKVEIYQDPEESLADSELARTLQNYTNSLQSPIQDVTNTAIVLDPPTTQISLSPQKRSSPQSSPGRELRPDWSFPDSVSFPPPETHFQTDSPPKKSNYGPYYPTFQVPEKGFFHTFSTNGAPPKEARRLSISSIPAFNVSDPLFPNNLPNFSKRPAPEYLYIERPSKRAKVQEEFMSPVPDPEDMPAVPDEDGKPNYSYAQLIAMAILRAPNRRLTLSQIYKWISDTFSFYRDPNTGTGWQNSIRHNLSLSKSFVKKDRPREDPGKGSYWVIIDEATELALYNDKNARRPAQVTRPFYEQPPSDSCPMPAAPLPPAHTHALTKTSANADSSGFPAESISSDATLPMSEHEEEQALAPVTAPAPPAPQIQSPGIAALSSSPPDLNSSPPFPRHASRHDTPAHLRRGSLSRSGNLKKRFDSFKDSGFFSSIESSIPRAPVGPLLTSEADHHQRSTGLKRGRAEEEIARIRGSSMGLGSSPTRPRHTFKKPRLDAALNSSSPMRVPGSHIGFPPLTPGLKFHPPTKAPPTVSPGTYLRQHRESIRDLVGTPANKDTLYTDDFKFTPSFIFADENAWSPHFSPERSAIKPSPLKQHTTFDDIRLDPPAEEDRPYAYPLPGQDSDEDEFQNILTDGSPISKKTMRPSVNHRPSTSTSALQDITKSRQNVRLGSPISFPAPKKAGNRAPSPAKKIIQPKNDVFLGAVDSSDDEMGKGALDLTKGFASIGRPAGKENEPVMGSFGPPKKGNMKASRPPLGRSSTNIV